MNENDVIVPGTLSRSECLSFTRWTIYVGILDNERIALDVVHYGGGEVRVHVAHEMDVRTSVFVGDIIPVKILPGTLAYRSFAYEKRALIRLHIGRLQGLWIVVDVGMMNIDGGFTYECEVRKIGPFLFNEEHFIA